MFRFGQGDAGSSGPCGCTSPTRCTFRLNVYSVRQQLGNLRRGKTVCATDGSSATMRRSRRTCRTKAPTAANVTLTTQDGRCDQYRGRGRGDHPERRPRAKLSCSIRPRPSPTRTLWYPNNSPYGKHRTCTRSTISLKSTASPSDVFEDPLGIRTITWDKDFPYINGQKHLLYGASARYDYPALGTAVPPEAEWRDAKLLADIGGSLWRPGPFVVQPRISSMRATLRRHAHPAERRG